MGITEMRVRIIQKAKAGEIDALESLIAGIEADISHYDSLKAGKAGLFETEALPKDGIRAFKG